MNQLTVTPLSVDPGVVRKAAHVIWDFDAQCLRILRCTALALANSPGGLRFKAGTRPWLDAVTQGMAGRDKILAP